MSLNALATRAFERAYGPAYPVAAFQSAPLAAAAELPTPPSLPPSSPARRRVRPAAPAAGPGKSGDLQSALALLALYFPTEVVAFFVPMVALARQYAGDPGLAALALYVFAALVATPALILLAYRDRCRANRRPWRLLGAWREMLLGVPSFALWGACVPGVFTPLPGWTWVFVPCAAFAVALVDRFLQPGD